MTQRIYIYSPSSAMGTNKAAVKRGAARLTALGYDVEIDASALATHMRFAGDDEVRLAAIHRAAASGADMALITRGGYGLTRLLAGIKYKAVAKAIDRGMLFVGHSDFTALQSAVLAKTGATTWAGPALGEDFGGEAEPDDITQDCFLDLLTGRGEGSGWQLPKAEAVEKPWQATGTLWGSNLSVLTALVGTPYLPEVPGGILFLEDVHEHPYRVERMLTQLLHAGVLGRQKAILLGHFTNFKPVPHDRGYGLKTVVQWLRTQVKCPVLTGLPFGHVPTKLCLPVGAKVTLAAEGRDAVIVWGHRHDHDHP